MLQSVKLQETIRYNWDKIRQRDTIKTKRTFTHKDSQQIRNGKVESNCLGH